MIAQEIEGAIPFQKPKDWDEAVDGRCYSLPVRCEEFGRRVRLVSHWKPTGPELARLNAGAFVELSCIGIQPPVAVNVTMLEGGATADASGEEADPRPVGSRS